MDRIGPLVIVEGRNKSKVPFSRSLYIDCSEKVLIDSGADPKSLMEVKQEYGIESIFNTHYHPDHTYNNHLFPNAKKLMNPIEFDTCRTVEGIAKANGIFQEWGNAGVEEWKKSLPQRWLDSLGEVSDTYDYEHEYQFGAVRVVFLHTPGHTSGLSSPYFPDQGVVYVSDYDMTSFGPWYNGTDGNIDDFIKSGRRLLELDAKTYITGHQKGIFSKHDFQVEMEKFLSIIDKRDEMISKHTSQHTSFEELANIGIFYPKNTLQVPIFRTWERSGIRKHLKRLGHHLSKVDGDLIISN